ncbi:MAG TPA: hypothetical protein VLH09_10065, partial [Bryobacteraceae bacterium]|nr:hypothetical protein [Bryobacteraceae bacterium]
DKAVRDADDAKRNRLRGIYGAAAMAMTPETTDKQKQEIYVDAITRARSEGLIKDGDAPAQFPGVDEFRRYGWFLMTGDAVSEEARKLAQDRIRDSEEARKAAEFKVTLPQKELELATKRRQDAAAQLAAVAEKSKDDYAQAWYGLRAQDPGLAAKFPHPDQWDAKATAGVVRQVGMTPEQQVTAAQGQTRIDLTRSGQAETARHNKVMEGLRRESSAGVSLPPAPAFGAVGERNEAFLAQLDTGTANTVKAIIDGRYPVPTGAALRSPQIQRLLNATATYEPGFDLTQWKTRADTRTEFAKGNAARNIRSLNTLIDHAGKLMDVTDRLGNWGFAPANRVANTVRANTIGSPALRDWNIASQAVISEAVSLFKGTGATNQEIDEMRQHFLPNGTMEEQKSGIRTIIGLAFGRLQALDDQFKNALKKPRDFRFLSPKSVEILKKKIGVDPDEVDPAPDGGSSTPAPRASASDPLGIRPGATTAAPNKAIDLSKYWTK